MHFKPALLKAYERFEILSECGLQATLARLLHDHVGKIGGSAEHYRVTCGVRLKNTNKIPDILIWRRVDPRFWIELKDSATFDNEAVDEDWRKLQEYCVKNVYPEIRGGFLIYVARHGKEFPHDLCPSTELLCAKSIILEQEMGPKFKDWEKEYRERAHYHSVKVRKKAAGR